MGGDEPWNPLKNPENQIGSIKVLPSSKSSRVKFMYRDSSMDSEGLVGK